MTDAIQQAVDRYIQMEKDAEVIQLMRQGHITGIERFGNEWRVDTRTHFYARPTLEEAVLAALKGTNDGHSDH